MLYRFNQWFYWNVTPWGRRRKQRVLADLAALRAKLRGESF